MIFSLYIHLQYEQGYLYQNASHIAQAARIAIKIYLVDCVVVFTTHERAKSNAGGAEFEATSYYLS